jgi:hypothetical protein
VYQLSCIHTYIHIYIHTYALNQTVRIVQAITFISAINVPPLQRDALLSISELSKEQEANLRLVEYVTMSYFAIFVHGHIPTHPPTQRGKPQVSKVRYMMSSERGIHFAIVVFCHTPTFTHTHTHTAVCAYTRTMSTHVQGKRKFYITTHTYTHINMYLRTSMRCTIVQGKKILHTHTHTYSNMYLHTSMMCTIMQATKHHYTSSPAIFPAPGFPGSTNTQKVCVYMYKQILKRYAFTCIDKYSKGMCLHV